uniref:Variant surface glycoprotein 1125.4985 n=1 Tax=Trypanosoma brucei TaxID=5691 RepID=A0A1J0RBL0_9TRYP|nr:variant surface glycoprotein 1125.4985 [Trypanosoma brucei]
MFFKDHTATKPNSKPSDANVKHAMWDGMWPTWLEAETQLRGNSPDKDIEAADMVHLYNRSRAMAAKAAATYSAIAPDSPNADKIDNGKAEETLAQAVYSKKAAPADQPTAKKVPSTSATHTRDKVCTTTDTNKLQAMLSAAACLCHKLVASSTEGARGAPVQQATGWTDTNTYPSGTDLQALVNSCGRKSNKVLTGSDLKTKLNNVLNLIKVKDEDGYLGSYINRYSGNSANGLCVKFTGYDRDPDSAINEIKLLQPLIELANELSIREKHNAADKAASQQLKNLLEKVKATSTVITLYPQLTEPPATAVSTKIPASTDKTQEECGKHHASQENCTRAECDYDTTAADGKNANLNQENKARQEQDRQFQGKQLQLVVKDTKPRVTVRLTKKMASKIVHEGRSKEGEDELEKEK